MHLVVALQRLGAGIVHHEAHVRLVDACDTVVVSFEAQVRTAGHADICRLRDQVSTLLCCNRSILAHAWKPACRGPLRA